MSRPGGELLRPIGGEMELEQLTVGAEAVPNVMRERGISTVATGRTALYLAARAVRAAGTTEALVPSYICASVVQALGAARLRVNYYAVDDSLAVNAGSLVEAARSAKRSLVVVVNYFGFPTGHAVSAALEPIRRNVAVVEDCAHGSWLETDEPRVGRIGDFVLTSFRKYLPLPDGGVLLNRSGLDIEEPKVEADGFARVRLAAKLLRAECVRGTVDGAAETTYLRLFENAERAIDARLPIARMSSISRALLPTCDLRLSMARRRANYRRVLTACCTPRIARVLQPLFGVLPRGISPLVFPLRVSRGGRNALRHRLQQARVFCPVHWPLPRAVDRKRFAASHALASDMLGLPIDQRYGSDAMDDLIDRLTFACKGLG